MKYAIVVPDGMAGRPLEQLGDRTPIEAAETPNMDSLAREGTCGLARTIPDGMPPGSDIANMSILGYDPKCYHTGRAPLEAPGLGVSLDDGDVAFRCNLVTLDGKKLADYSAGGIATDEARELIEHLQANMRGEEIRFYAGVSYRHLLVLPAARAECLRAECIPPHDITGREYAGHFPKGPGSDFLRALIVRSRELLAGHPVNVRRKSRGKRPANSIWLWGQGTRPQLAPFAERFGISGAMITAVDLLRGLAYYAGLDVIEVEGATGGYDTNYAGKGEAAVESLAKCDLVLVHVESPDEAGHNGEVDEKVRAIENVDRFVLAPLVELARSEGEMRVLVVSDHPTPIVLRTHVSDPTPFVLWGPGIGTSGAEAFSEQQAAGGLFVPDGTRLMQMLLAGKAQGTETQTDG